MTDSQTLIKSGIFAVVGIIVVILTLAYGKPYTILTLIIVVVGLAVTVVSVVIAFPSARRNWRK